MSIEHLIVAPWLERLFRPIQILKAELLIHRQRHLRSRQQEDIELQPLSFLHPDMHEPVRYALVLMLRMHAQVIQFCADNPR